MNRNFKFFVLSLLIFLVAACDDKVELGDLNYILNEAGTLKVSIVDKDLKAIEGAKFLVFDYEILKSTSLLGNILNTESVAIRTGLTDNKGEINFGKLNKGTYIIACTLNSNDFSDLTIYQFTQIVADHETTIPFNVSDYEGSLDILAVGINQYNSKLPLDSLNIALIPTSEFKDYYSFNDLLSRSIPCGTTNDNGIITANNLPIGNYYMLGYYDNMRYDIMSDYSSSGYSYITITRGETLKKTMYGETAKLIATPEEPNQYYRFNLSFQQSSGYEELEDFDFTKVKVFLTTSSSSTFSSAYVNKTFETSCDSTGVAKIPKTLGGNDYYVWFYTDATNYQRNNSWIYLSTSSSVQTFNFTLLASNFNKLSGSVTIHARGFLINGNQIDTINLNKISIMLTKNYSNYFSTSSSSNIIQNTDENGIVHFENIPDGKYFLWAFTDNNHAQRSNLVVDVTANKTTTYSPVFNATTVSILKANLNLEIVASTNSGLEPIKNADVIITKSHPYDVAAALNIMFKSGKTDANGKISFNNLETGIDYHVTVYRDLDRFYISSTSYRVVYNADNNFKIQTNTIVLKP